MNFTDILDEYRVSYDTSGRNKNRPGWVNFACTVCGRYPYMGYNVAGRYVNAWCCGRVSLHAVLRSITGSDDVAALLGELPHERLPDRISFTGTLKEPPGREKLYGDHSDYLRSRGFATRVLKRLWNVQRIAGLGGRYAWRLYIPVHLRGEVVSFTTRAVGAREPRYLAARDEESAVSIRDCVYGIDYCRGAVVLVEGPTDVWAGGPGFAAIMNVKASAAQLEQLSRIPVRAICFDREWQAQLAARELARDLSIYPGTTHLVELETGKDVAEASIDEVEAIRKEFLL